MHRFFVNHIKEKKGEDVSLDSLRHQLKNVIRFRKEIFLEELKGVLILYPLK